MKSWKYALYVMVVLLAGTAFSVNVTLPEDMLLGLNETHPLFNTSVINQQAVTGGIQYDVSFPGSGSFDIQLFYSMPGDLDLSDYDNFQLTFSYLGGVDLEQTPDLALFVSPYVVDAFGRDMFFTPVPIVVDSAEHTATASMEIPLLGSGPNGPGDNISRIGFQVLIDPPDVVPGGYEISLLVSPTAGAVPIPEPVSVLLLAIGGAILRRKD